MAARWLLVAAMAAVAAAECANGCSGHGECGTNDQCECYDGFVGGDCSLRVCPMASAFVDAPRGDLNHDGKVGYLSKVTSPTAANVATGYSKVQWSRFLQYESWPTISLKTAFVAGDKDANGNIKVPVDVEGSNVVGGWKAQKGEAHFMTECAGKGSCDRASGACKCFEGYTGSACQRTTCPSDCSGHGVCRTVREIALAGSGRRFVESLAGTNVYTGMATPYDYRLWDADQGAACVCDSGYGGIDCSLRQCPLGDDPLTYTKETCGGLDCRNEVQAFSVDGNQLDTSAGTYKLVYTDFSGVAYTTSEFKLVTKPAGSASKANEAAVKAALESLPNNVTGEVTVTTDTAFTGGATGAEQCRMAITFTRSGNIPDMQLIWAGTSNPNTKRSYVFQPGMPLKSFAVRTSASANLNGDKKLQIKVYPTDATLFSKPEYWVSDAVTIDADADGTNQDSEIAAAVATALNSIPAVRLVYGAPFAADKNVLLAKAGATSTSPSGNPTYRPSSAGDSKTVLVAFPGKLFGQNKVEVTFTTGANVVVDSDKGGPVIMKDNNDVLDGNKEYVTCSNRGICDFGTGLCKCFAGYTGVACDTQSTLAM